MKSKHDDECKEKWKKYELQGNDLKKYCTCVSLTLWILNFSVRENNVLYQSIVVRKHP